MSEGNNINILESVTLPSMEKILYQMKYCICKIKAKGASGTGFFCMIPIENKKMVCLITSYQLLNEKYFNNNNKINILYNDYKEAKEINIDKERIKYFNKKYDITIIEILKSDEINNYLELDDNLFKKEIKIFYEEKTIYSIQYPHGNNISVSYGILNNIDENYIINHTCNTIEGAYCSPILNLSNNKVIGINNEFNLLSGILLNLPLNDFINKNKQKQKPNLYINISNNIYNKKIIINHTNITQSNSKEQKIKKTLKKAITLPNYNNKTNVVFQHYTGFKTNLIVEFGTTIDLLLKEYLIKINRENIIDTDEYIFRFNGSKIKFGDQTQVEKIFGSYGFVDVLRAKTLI